MKKYTLLFFSALMMAVACNVFAQGQARNIYRVYVPAREQVESLLKLDIDIVATNYGRSIDIRCSGAKADSIASLGLRIELVMTAAKAAAAMEVPEGFHDYDETKAFLGQMAALYPSITVLDSIGRSTENRALWALKISDNPTLDEDEHCFLVEGCIHGNEHHSLEVCLYFIQYLLENYGTDPEVTYWIDNREIWVVSLVNPDGHELNQRRSFTNIDLNRNFGYFWSLNASYYGPAQFSEPETQAIRNLAVAVKPYGSIAFHTAGRLILYPWAYTSWALPPDSALFVETGTEIRNAINTVNIYRQYTLLRSGVWYWHGGEHNDYFYSQFGMLSYTFELMTSQTAAPSQLESEVVLEGLKVMLRRPDKQAVTGIISDAVTGTPIEAVFKIKELLDEKQLQPRKSDPLYGRYIRFLTPGDYTLEVYASGYTKETRSITISASGPVQIIDLPLQRAPDIVLAGTSINNSSFVNSEFGRLPRGEGVKIAVLAVNNGYSSVKGMYAELSTDAPEITIVRDSVYFGTVDSAGTAISTGDFIVNVGSNVDRGKKINFTVDFYDTSGNHWQSQFFESFEFFSDMSFDDESVLWEHRYVPGAVNTHNDWQWGEPGGKYYDPSAAHSPDFVWGTDLGGSGDWNGAYQNNVNNYLELPAIYTGGWNQVNLQYYRWLNVMSGDRAYITANDIVVWDNFSYAVSELEWFRQIVDITPASSGCDSVVIRFRLHTNASGMDGGWNIDDIMVSRDVFVSVDDEKQLSVPEQFRLYQNYPNPFNPATTITFDIPKPQLIKLAVYNVLGQEVKTLVSTLLPAGTYRFIWQGDNTHGEKVAGGVYFMRLTGQNQQSTKKLLLVR